MKLTIKMAVLYALAVVWACSAGLLLHDMGGHNRERPAVYHVLSAYAADRPSDEWMPGTNMMIGHDPAIINVPYQIAGDATQSIPTPLPPPPPIMIAPQNFDQAAPVIQMTPPKQTLLLGDYASAALEWLLPILAPVLAAFMVDALIKLRGYLGQSTSDAQRDKLQQMTENAVNLALHEGAHNLAGKMPVEVNSQVMARAVDYVQAHGADTLKALGVDPTSPSAVEAIKGRVATILANKQAAPAVSVTPAAPGTPRVTAT